MERGILAAIGNTPLVELARVIRPLRFRLYAKLEALNPGGSTKDRPAFNILKEALQAGLISSGTVVIESSSGNMGVGLAQACSYFGLRFICVVDPKTTLQNIRLLEAYGAKVDLVREPDAGTGEFRQARLNRVNELVQSTGNSFWPNQYVNVHNAAAHHQTMREIAEALDGSVDFLFCATSTCGTLRGCAEYIRDQKLRTRVIAVDAVGSVIFGGERGKRLVPGHGAAVRPRPLQARPRGGLCPRYGPGLCGRVSAAGAMRGHPGRRVVWRGDQRHRPIEGRGPGWIRLRCNPRRSGRTLSGHHLFRFMGRTTFRTGLPSLGRRG